MEESFAFLHLLEWMVKRMLLQQLINGISLGAVYALMAVGFALVFSILKFSNFGHGSVIMLSAYLGLWASNRFGLGLLATLAVCTIGGGLMAVVIERIGFKPIRDKKGPLIYLFVSSIAISMFFRYLMTALLGGRFYMYRPLLQTTSLRFAGVTIPVVNLAMLAASVVALTFLLYVLYRTTIGIAIRAASTDLVTPSLMGINTDLIVSVTFFISGALAGIAGLFLGMSLNVYPQLGNLVLKAFVATVVGGLGSLGGAVVAAFLLGLLETMITAYVSGAVTPMVSFTVMILFLLFKPEGVAGLLGLRSSAAVQKL